MIWKIKRVIEKLDVYIKGKIVQIIYHSSNRPNVLGKVYLDNKNIEFGKNVTLYPGVHIFGSGKVIIGDNVVIGDGTIICASENIVIGNDSMIAGQSYIIDCNHGMKLSGLMREQQMSSRPVIIGENVWVGCGCKILAGSILKEGSVIGAGTVIAGEVEKNTIFYSERRYCSKIRK